MKRNITQVNFDDVIVQGQENPSKSSIRTFTMYSLFLLFSTLVFSLSSFAQISGTKSVGTGGDYATLTDAFADITAQGLNGNIDLQLTGTYSSDNETSFPLNAPPAAQIGTNTVNIYPVTTGVTIYSTSATGIINLSGTKNIDIDGRVGKSGTTPDLTIYNLNTTTGYVINIANNSVGNTIEYCKVQGGTNSYTIGVINFGAGTTGNNNNTIKNCSISNYDPTGTPGATPKMAIYSSNGTGTSSGNLINANNIFNYFNATDSAQGVHVATGNTGWTITNNSFYQTASRTGTAAASLSHSGVLIKNTGSGYVITGNYFGGTAPLCAGTALTHSGGTIRYAAINIQQVATTAGAVSIQDNTVRNINHTATATVNPVFVGIWVVLGSASIGTTTGNTIGSNTGTGSITVTSGTGGAATNGILATTNGQLNVENNKIGSINIVAATTGTTSTITAISMTPGQTGTGSWTCNNNVIGSTVTSNSINLSTASTVGTSTANGISILVNNIPVSVSGNTIANINYNALTSGPVLRGALIQGTGVTYTINSNTVFNLTAQNTTTPAVSQNSTSSCIGLFINLQGSTTANNIDDNTIYGIRNNNTGAVSTRVVGMIVSSSVTPTVRRAKIYDITNASTGTSTTAPPLAIGFQVFGGGATLVNSMITLGLGQTTNTTYVGYWCNANGAGPYNLYYSTINITGTAASGALPSFGFQRGGFVTSGGNNTVSATVDIRDNILNNERTGGTGKHYAISNANLSGGAGWGVNASNFNILNSANPSTVAQWYNTGTVTLEDKTFATWKTISASDASSISGAVVSTYFTDPTMGDLHINAGVNGTQIESAGSVVSGYTTDFDNQTRPGPTNANGGGTAPDIGADEFDGVILDIVAPTIAYTPLNNTSLTGGETLTNFATVTDAGAVNITVGTRPRLYYKRSTDASVFNDNTSATAGWKYDEANNTGPQFSFTIDYTRLQGGSVTVGNIIQYFVVAQDVNVPTPNVAINAGTFSSTPTSVALVTANFPNPASVLSYKITPALSGTVTVGAGGTYTSLTNAGGLFEAINNSALTGNLVANIISDITNESGVNTLLQAAEDGVGAGTYTVTIKPSGAARTISGTPTVPQLIRLDGADRVTIDGSLSGGTDRSLTIANLGTDYDNGILTSMSVVAVLSASSSNGALNNTVKNCIIRGLSNVGTQIAIVQGGDVDGSGPLSPNNNNTYRNNLIFAAEYGVYMEGGANPETGNIVAGNTIGSPFDALKTSYIGFFCEGESGLQITDNNILGVVGSVNGDNVYGIFVNYKIPGLIMTGNNVQNVRNTNAGGGALGIGLGAFAGPNLNMLIANNTVSDISCPGTNITTAPNFFNNAYGICVFNSGSGGASYKIYHNSVNMNTNQTTANSMSAAFFSSTSGVGIIDMRNNSFANVQTTNNRYAIYLTTTTSTMFSTINRNDYYVASGGNVGFVNSVVRSNLAAWQSATGQDANSISADPKYNTPTVLGPLTGSPLIGAGQNVGVTTDQIAIVRSVTTPSIGAYELAGDYAVPTITYKQLPFVCSGGNVSLVATIVDFSGVNITATLRPRIYFKKNNGSYFSTAGTQLTGSPQNGTWNFTINTTTLGGVTTGDVISYFVIAQDRAPNINVGTGPVGGFGSDVNTVTALPIPDSFKIATALAPGTYTVGTAGNYTSLTAAMNAYNTSCLSGPVVFSLIDSKSYSTGTGESFPINILENPYASATNTLTIKPAPGVTASITSTTNRVFILKGADYVAFDGSNTVNGTTRDLTLQSTLTSTGGVVYYMQSLGVGKGATNNTIKNCIIQNGTKGNGSDVGTVTSWGVYSSDVNGSAGPDNDNFTLTNNNFRYSSIGVFGISDVTGTLDNWVVTNNTFGNSADFNTTLGRTGMSLSFANNLNVSGNTFTNIGVSDAGTATGLNLGSTVTNVTIRKNVFVDIKYTGANTNAYGGRAISINSGVPSSNIVIDNNSISNITGTGSSDSLNAIIGIRLLGATDGVRMYYNSINLGSGSFSGAAAGIFSACVYVGPIVTNLDIRNNLFHTNLHNTNGAVSATARSYSLFSNAPSSAYTNINNNNYSFSNATTPLQGRLAAIGGIIRNTLADIITGFGQNANSVSAIPVFTSATDLHLTAAGNCGLDNKAQQLATYTTDFDGQTRASGINKPDIGFDEFTSSNTQWTGTVSTVWTNAANWCAGVVPDATIDVTIPAGTPFAPALNGTANVNNLILSDGATINLGTFTLNVAGSFSTPGTGTGAFLGGIYSKLNVAGASTARLNVTGANINAVAFNSASGSTITLGTPVNVIGKLDIKGNTLVAGTNNLTFKSNPSGTANLAPVLSGGSITGTVTVERYIPNNQKRAWRLLSVPVTGTQTFNAAWQEGNAPMANTVPGFGTLLTKVGGGSGYDAASGNSLLQFTPGSPGSWSPVSSTTNAMQTTAGYFVYIRGDRSVGINPGIFFPGATTLRTKGSLYVGNQTISLPAGNNVLVGNLFASAIDFTALGGGKTSFKVWDPKAGADSVPGAYQTFSALNGYQPTPGGGSYIGVSSNTRIESGAAFIVSGTGSIVLNESAKVDNSRNTFRSSEKIKQLKTNLIVDTKSGALLLDGNAVVFDAKYSNKVDDLDVPKMLNTNENFGINNADNQLVIEARGLINSDDAIQYNLSNLKKDKEYALEFIGDNLDAGTNAYLVDNFLGTTTNIDLTTTTRIKFSVSETPASYASNRFKLVFKAPVVNEELVENNISISPNPVTNGQIRVRIADSKEGNYTVRFFNRTGQVIQSQVIKHTGSVSVNSLLLNTKATNGVYQVEIIKPNRERFVQNLLISNTK